MRPFGEALGFNFSLHRVKCSYHRVHKRYCFFDWKLLKYQKAVGYKKNSIWK